MRRIAVIDSHTGGEPTRVVLDGAPDLGTGTIAEKAVVFRDRFDDFRRLIVNEPRGSDVLVGALLLAPVDPKCQAGAIFFNNVGVLGMCGHGMIGLVATLAHLGRIEPGEHQFETVVGPVSARLHDDGRVSVRNVPSYQYATDVLINVDGHGPLRGDIAWGGNWFFLTADHAETLTLASVDRLTDFTWRIRQSLKRAGISGANGGEIDHIELFGQPADAANQSRNFVLCPGKAYDRSPCGTGTSAKLACLAAAGKLQPGQVWRQESISGSVFEGVYERCEGSAIIPTITGTAFVMAETSLLVDPRDRWPD